MSFLSGKGGRIVMTGPLQVFPTYHRIKSWSVEVPNHILDVTNGETGGFGQFIAGIGELHFDIQLDHDVGTDPFENAFVQGVILSNVYLFATADQTNYWSIASAIVQDVSEHLDVRGLCTSSLKGMATTGTFSFTENGSDPIGS